MRLISELSEELLGSQERLKAMELVHWSEISMVKHSLQHCMNIKFYERNISKDSPQINADHIILISYISITYITNEYVKTN